MTGFMSIAGYSPWLVLLVGLFSVAAILGAGNRIGSWLRLPQPFATVAGAVVAIELFTLSVESIAMAHAATRAVLIALWIGVSAAGTVLLVAGRARPRLAAMRSLPIAAVAVILTVNLLIAICPSTKRDETYYHMIVPARIVLDASLVFYRDPIIAAIVPQMAFQTGFAPFHALGVPDAGNVVSWFFGALLVWFTHQVVRTHTGSKRWAAVFSAAVVAGLYPSIWHVTSGAHAIGDLAVTAVIVALFDLDRIAEAAGIGRTAFAVGALAAAGASTKVLLFPLAAAVVLVAVVRLGPRALGPLAIPSIVFMVPLMVWTAIHAGSPLGPLMEGSTGPSPYFPNEVRTFMSDYVAGPRGPFLEKLRNEAVNYSPVVWLSIAGLLVARGRIRTPVAVGLAFLLLQAIVILGWNTWDARYFGGVHYALMIVFAMFLDPSARDRLAADRRFVTVAAMLIVPWMVLQVAYAAPFLRFVAGGSKNRFYSRYVALFDDFVALDRILPRHAILLSVYGIESVYAPRPLYYHPLDMPDRGTPYLLSFDQEDEPGRIAALTRRFTLGEEVYRNDRGAVAVYRTPGKEPVRRVVRVWRLR